MTGLQRKLVRKLDLVYRGEDLVVLIAREGIYIRGHRRRWSSALFLEWRAAYDYAAKLRAAEVKRERVLRRKYNGGAA